MKRARENLAGRGPLDDIFKPNMPNSYLCLLGHQNLKPLNAWQEKLLSNVWDVFTVLVGTTVNVQKIFKKKSLSQSKEIVLSNVHVQTIGAPGIKYEAHEIIIAQLKTVDNNTDSFKHHRCKWSGLVVGQSLY